jgi:hypothetical protein
LEIRLNHGLELLTTLLVLSETAPDQFLQKTDNHLYASISQRLSDFREHPMTRELSRLWDAGVSWSDFLYLAVSLQADFSLDSAVEIAPLNESGVPWNDIRAFVDQLPGFVTEMGFTELFEETCYQEAEYLSTLNSIIAERPVIKRLEDYLGMPVPAPQVVLSTLMRPCMSLSHTYRGARREYCFCSRHWTLVAEHNGYLGRMLIDSIWHEFSHSVINPLSDTLFPNGHPESDTEVEWYCALNESIIWGITTRMLENEGMADERTVRWHIDNGHRNRAPKTEAMYHRLGEYQLNRTKYPSIASFLPIILEEFGPIPTQ